MTHFVCDNMSPTVCRYKLKSKFYDLYVKLVYTLTNDQVNQHLQYSYVHELIFYPSSLLCLQVYYLLHITETKPGLECATITKSGEFFY